VKTNTPPKVREKNADRLLTFREVNEALGFNCKTSHTARNLAKRGQITAVHINERTVRFTESSVRNLVSGAIDPVAAAAKGGRVQ
jgi:predicted DNA-binding transcriptional regulator AlpA